MLRSIWLLPELTSSPDLEGRVNPSAGPLCGTLLQLPIHLPSAQESAGLGFHGPEQSLGSRVSVGANCLFGLAKVVRLAS